LWLLLLFTYSGTDGEYFNLDEIDTNVKFSLSILETPVAYGDLGETKTESSIVMTNKFGQKYHCELPEEEEVDEGGEEDAAGSVNIHDLLQPLHDGPCLVKTKDWWTYEICTGRSIRQFHMENDKPVGLIMNLGLYDPARGEESEKMSYHPEWYSNGTKCDLTNELRTTEVRYICNEAAVQEFIGDIFEPKSCEYTVVIHTAKLCAVPHLRPAREKVPLDIGCKPIVSQEKLEKYQRYAELKAKKAEFKLKKIKKQQQTWLSMLTGSKDSPLVKDMPKLPSLDSFLTDLSSFMKTALKGAEGGVQTLALQPDASSEEDEVTLKKTEKREMKEQEKEDWNLVHKPRKEAKDPTVQKLKDERNAVWEKISEYKSLLKKYSSQLHDTEIFLQKNLEREAKYDAGLIDKLEIQKKQLEKAVEKTRETLAELESEERRVKANLDNHLQKLNQVVEEIRFTVEELRLMKRSGLNDVSKYHDILNGMLLQFNFIRGYQLRSFSEWFDLAEEYAQVDVADLRRFYKFADGELSNLESYTANDDVTQQTLKARENLDLLKAGDNEKILEHVRSEHPDILSEAEAELGEEDAVAGMEQEMKDLLRRLGGAEKNVENVQATINQIRGLKRDGKKSVKKELREEEDEEEDSAIKEAKRKLVELESELDQVETGLMENKKRLKEEQKKKSSLEEALETKELAAKLETSIKAQLEKLGLDNADRPIEIKVITTSLSPGEDPEDQEMLLHNLITGDEKGYQDLNSQRQTVKNYKFSIEDSMLEKMEKELAALEQVEETGGVDRLGDKSHLYHVIEDEDVSGDENGENPAYEVIQERLGALGDLMGFGEERRRPSSLGYQDDENPEFDENEENWFDQEDGGYDADGFYGGPGDDGEFGDAFAGSYPSDLADFHNGDEGYDDEETIFMPKEESSNVVDHDDEQESENSRSKDEL